LLGNTKETNHKLSIKKLNVISQQKVSKFKEIEYEKNDNNIIYLIRVFGE